MKLDFKSNFMFMVLSLTLVILFSSYLGTVRKEGFEDDEDDFGGEDFEQGDEFTGIEIPEQYQRPEGISDADWARMQEEGDEDEEWDALVAKVDNLEKVGKDVNSLRRELDKAVADNSALERRIKSESEIKSIAQGEINNKNFADKNFVTNFFDETGLSEDVEKLERELGGAKSASRQVGDAVQRVQGIAEAAKAQAMAAMNKIPPQPDLSGLQPKGNYATKADLERLQPKGDYAIKGDYATKADLGALKFQAPGDYATNAQLGGYVTQADLKTKLENQGKGNYATQEQLNDLRNEFNSKF